MELIKGSTEGRARAQRLGPVLFAAAVGEGITLDETTLSDECILWCVLALIASCFVENLVGFF